MFYRFISTVIFKQLSAVLVSVTVATAKIGNCALNFHKNHINEE